MVVFEVLILIEAVHHLRGPEIHGDDFFNRLVAERANDEWRAGFIDENAVRFVHQAEMGATLDRHFTTILNLGRGELP